MIRPTTISIALDVANEDKIDRVHKNLTMMLKKIREYNKEVEKANTLLREQEKLRGQSRKGK